MLMSPVDPYTLRLLDRTGQVTAILDLYCDDEAAAIHRARQFLNDHEIEIWYRGERIALLGHADRPH